MRPKKGLSELLHTKYRKLKNCDRYTATICKKYTTFAFQL